MIDNTEHAFIDYDYNFDLKLFDNNIFNCDLNVENKTTVIELKEINKCILEIDSIYDNPYAVRNLIKESPHAINAQVNNSQYPGYVTIISAVNLDNLETIIKKAVSKFIKDVDVNDFRKLEFCTGIYTKKDILYDNSVLMNHRDVIPGFKNVKLAGVIYLNEHEEIHGGTAFYNDDNNLIYINRMKFNSLILYPSDIIHSIYIDSSHAYRTNYRITQRIFM